MRDIIAGWLAAQGWGEKTAEFGGLAAALMAILVAAIVADFAAKHLLLKAVSHLVRKTRTKWDDIFLEHKVFDHLAHLVPGLIIYLFVPLMFREQPLIGSLIERFCIAYMLLMAVIAVGSFLDGILSIYRNYEIAKSKPIKGYVQVAKIVVYFTVGILILSALLERSPIIFLSGLGAITAVLLLIFKDTILGFVASIQLTANDMVQIDDWIAMPKYGADGDVIDVSLTTVKVRNWDKTITTIPTYALTTDAFKNWRGMSESGGRRIKRAVNLDMNSICFCDEAMLARFKKIQFISEYVERKVEEVARYNRDASVDESSLVNGRRLTNIGTFRAYVESYLRNHPMIHEEMTFLVRQLAPTEHGLPIEIYVFSKDQRWVNYEGIQSDIFDHVLAVIPQFDLRVFQRPAGADIQAVALPREGA